MTTAHVTAQRPRRPSGVAATAPWVLAAATVLAQVAYPLLDGDALQALTMATVVLFFAASVTHAWAHRGARWALALVAVTAGGGLVAEAVGVGTGYPFGSYSYAGSLGPKVFDVPVIVPMAWTMLAYPVLLAARRLTRRYVAVVGGVGLASWDLFLDPQMVAAGHWTWTDPTPSLPGIAGVPLTNYAGWLLVAVVMMALLHGVLPEQAGISEVQPAVLLVWTWLGSVVGNAIFFDRPAVALVGGVVMGLVVAPYALSLWQDRP